MITKSFVKMYYDFLRDGFEPTPQLKRQIRYDLKSCHDPLKKSLREESRFYYPPNDYEAMYEYGFADWLDWTDEEIKEAVNAMERHNTTPYDCSGKMCTCWISWKRTPVGVAIVHKLTLDV